MYHHPFIYGRQGPPRTVLYPGYYSNITRHSVFPDHEFYYPYPNYRKYPDVDPSLFNESAIEMKILMKDASLILTKLAESKAFAKEVMAAAQASNNKEVERLLKTTGIKSDVITTFNPDGINFKLMASVGGTKSSQLTLALRWR
ncbi:DNA topoisomerase [Bacillus timonensis]|uniref:hypothetical protein n=1 Tax=Bacillus timonensis TaxID=1033734 RepID=UPI0002897DC0|nr:hypothetical protein [Bacillus timonensis]